MLVFAWDLLVYKYRIKELLHNKKYTGTNTQIHRYTATIATTFHVYTHDMEV